MEGRTIANQYNTTSKKRATAKWSMLYLKAVRYDYLRELCRSNQMQDENSK